jgi:hypothetical protein
MNINGTYWYWIATAVIVCVLVLGTLYMVWRRRYKEQQVSKLPLMVTPVKEVTIETKTPEVPDDTSDKTNKCEPLIYMFRRSQDHVTYGNVVEGLIDILRPPDATNIGSLGNTHDDDDVNKICLFYVNLSRIDLSDQEKQAVADLITRGKQVYIITLLSRGDRVPADPPSLTQAMMVKWLPDGSSLAPPILGPFVYFENDWANPTLRRWILTASKLDLNRKAADDIRQFLCDI